MTYIPNICAPLKTGQTTSYETGDDGDLELGVSKKYTTLTTGQYSGTTNITVNSETHALSNNCVKDNRTGLMWARYVPTDDIGEDNDGMLYWDDSLGDDEDIWEALASANANSLGGYSDWRIPNYFELASIINLVNCSPSIDTTVFPSTPANYHWTASTTPCDSSCAFYVHFIDGLVYNIDKQTNKYFVRFVRG